LKPYQQLGDIISGAEIKFDIGDCGFAQFHLEIDHFSHVFSPEDFLKKGWCVKIKIRQ